MKKFFLSSLILLLASFSINAQDRPTIGLVLSGGGARGAAHVGVLKILEEMQIPIDVIAGTSMGSIVGGLYASGMSPSEIELALAEMDWDEALTDAQSRQYLSINRKRQQDLFTVSVKAGFADGQLKLPPGVILGQNVELALQRLTSHVAQITNFDDLVIPFRAVASDLAKGDAVVLSGGSLASAMRASMSVPSLFSPLELDGRILVDGGVTDNLPVNVARQMGADILIVIDISTPLRDASQLNDLLAVTDQLTRLLTGQNTRASRESLTANDILISPDLGDITASQFERSDEAVLIGEIEARNRMQELTRFSVSNDEYQTYLEGLNVIEPSDRNILQVTVDNQSRLSDEVIEGLVSTQTQETLDLSKVESDISQIYGLGFFEKAGYRLSQQSTGVDVEFYATPKSWGPNYLHFGFDMDGGNKGNNSTNVTFGYTRSEMNSLGAEWTSLLQLGSDPTLQSYFHQPIGRSLSFFVEPYFSINQGDFSLFTADEHELAQARIRHTEFGFSIGKEFGSRSAISLGLNRAAGQADILIGEPSLLKSEFDDSGVFMDFRYDTLDNIFFPTSGNIFYTTLYSSYDSLGDEFQQWRLDAVTVQSFKQHTVVLSATAGGTEKGQASLAKLFSLGGFFNLSGLADNQRSGQHLGLLKAAYYRRFDRIKFLPAYIGATVEYGGVWQQSEDISRDNTTLGGSLFIGLDSPVGPLLFGIGLTDEGDSTAYAKIGRIF